MKKTIALRKGKLERWYTIDSQTGWLISVQLILNGSVEMCISADMCISF